MSPTGRSGKRSPRLESEGKTQADTGKFGFVEMNGFAPEHPLVVGIQGINIRNGDRISFFHLAPAGHIGLAHQKIEIERIRNN